MILLDKVQQRLYILAMDKEAGMQKVQQKKVMLSDRTMRPSYIGSVTGANAYARVQAIEGELALREAARVLAVAEPNVDPRGAAAVFVMPWYGEHAAIRHLWRDQREALRDALADALDPEYAPDFATYIRQCQAEATLEG